MNNLKYITPEFFHNWLNDCPVKWERIEDNVDEISIKFYLPIVEEEVWTLQPMIYRLFFIV